MKSWVSQQLNSKTRIAIPIMTHPGIEMIGKTIKEAVQDGKIHALAIEKLSEIYPSAATTVIMDLSLEAEAFGCQIEFQENDMPHILGRLLNNSDDIYNLKVPELTSGRVPQYLLANKLTVEQTKNRPVLASTIGPFSLAGRLFNISELMMECYTDPNAVKSLLEKCTEFILKYCVELKQIGCSGVLIAEPAAGLLSNADCQVFSSDYIKRIVDAIQDDNFLVILHNCGNHGNCTEAMLKTEANAYHFGNSIDMVQTLKSCPKDKLIMGNVDPTGVMKMKSASDIKKYVGDLLNKTSAFKNFVLSTGCDMPPQVPGENIVAFFDALNEYNQKNYSVSDFQINKLHEV